MTFISYAQNLEDLMIWRTLNHIEKGFYVDVGANDPEIDSITKAFYDRGWRGINIEPITEHYNDLIRSRPNDINLQCVASSTLGDLEIWENEVRGWATISEDVIAQHNIDGFTGTRKKVSAIPLYDICKEHAEQEIHFLKIDVEGAEKNVIDGMNFSEIRPWIVVIESTFPNTLIPNYETWEQTITSADYLFGYTDGINRFYVAKEHSELLESLAYPPNIFDNYIFSQQYKSELRAQISDTRALQAKVEVERVSEHLKKAIATSVKASTQYDAIIASRSWRITAPLRRSVDFLKWFISGLEAWVKLKPGSRPHRIKAFLKKFQTTDVDPTSQNDKDHEYFSPRAVQIYNELTALKARRRKGKR